MATQLQSNDRLLFILKKKCNETKNRSFVQRVRRFVDLFKEYNPKSKSIEISGKMGCTKYNVRWVTEEKENRMITIEREENTTQIKEIKDITESLREYEINNRKLRFLYLTKHDLQNLININEVKEYTAVSKNNDYMRNLFKAKLVEMIKEEKGREFTRYTYKITTKGENYINSLLSIRVEY